MRWLKRLFRGGSDHAPDLVREPVESGPAQAPFVAFQPHNELEQSLMDAAVDPGSRPAFQRMLLASNLYAATPDTPEQTESRIAGEGERLSLLNIQAPDGASVAALFTAQERIIEVFGMGVGFVAIRGQELLEMVAGQGAWLNAGFPYSVYWNPEELAALLGKGKERTMIKDTQLMLGAPAEPPTALVAALQSALGSDPHIAEAWFALAHWPEDGSSSWYLDIHTDLDRSVVQQMLAQTFANADYAGKPLDMVVNRPGEREGVGIRLTPVATH